MSATANYYGGLERPEMTRLTTTNATTVKSAESGETIIASISLANETGTAVVVDLEYNDGSTDFLWWRGSVAGSGSETIIDLPLRLYESDVLKATAASANAITVYPVTFKSSAQDIVR